MADATTTVDDKTTTNVNDQTNTNRDDSANNSDGHDDTSSTNNASDISVDGWTLEDAVREVKKVRDESKKRRERIKQLEEQEAERIRQEQEKAGEFKSLYEDANAKLKAQLEELESLRKVRDERQAEIDARRKAILTELPDTVAKQFADATLAQLEALRDNLSANGTRSQGGGSSDSRTTTTSDDSPAPSLSGTHDDIIAQLNKNKG